MALRTRRLFPDEFAGHWRTLVPEINKTVPYHGPLDAEHTIRTVVPLLRNRVAVSFLLYDDAAPLSCYGLLFGFIHPNIFTGALEALEGGWFVLPCARGQESALLLMKAFEEFATGAGCVRVLSGSTVSYRPEAMRRLYRRQGYKPHAEAFSKDL